MDLLLGKRKGSHSWQYICDYVLPVVYRPVGHSAVLLLGVKVLCGKYKIDWKYVDLSSTASIESIELSLSLCAPFINALCYLCLSVHLECLGDA